MSFLDNLKNKLKEVLGSNNNSNNETKQAVSKVGQTIKTATNKVQDSFSPLTQATKSTADRFKQFLEEQQQKREQREAESTILQNNSNTENNTETKLPVTQKESTSEEKKDIRDLYNEVKEGNYKNEELSKSSNVSLLNKNEGNKSISGQRINPIGVDIKNLGNIVTNTLPTILDNTIKGIGTIEEHNIEREVFKHHSQDIARKQIEDERKKDETDSNNIELPNKIPTTEEIKSILQQSDNNSNTETNINESRKKYLKKAPSFEDVIGKGIINKFKDATGITELGEKANEEIAKNQSEMKTGVGKFLGEITPSLIQNASTLALSAVNPTMGMAQFSASAMGEYYDEAINKGMSPDEAYSYAGVMTSFESVTEKIITADTLDVAKSFLRSGTKETGKGVLKGFLRDAGENFAQEYVMEPLGQLTENAATGKNITEGMDDSELWDRAFKSGVQGAVSSIILTGASSGVASCISVQDKIENGETPTENDVYKAFKECEKNGINVKEVMSQTLNNMIGQSQEQQIQTETQQLNEQSTSEKFKQYLIDKSNGVENALENILPTAQNTQQINLPSTQEYSINNNSGNVQQEKAYSVDINNDTLESTMQANRQYFKSDRDYNRIYKQSKAIQNITGAINPNNSIKVLYDTSVDGDALITTEANGQRAIVVNPTTNKSAEEVIIHELFHGIRGTQEFNDIGKVLGDFANKVNLKDKNGNRITLDSVREDIRNRYETYFDQKNLDKSNLDIEEETNAFLLQNIIGDQKSLTRITQQHPKVIQKLYDMIDKVSMRLKGVDKETSDMIVSLRNKLGQALRSNNIAIEEGINLAKTNSRVDLEKGTYIDYNNIEQDIPIEIIPEIEVEPEKAKYLKYNHCDDFYKMSLEDMEKASAVVSAKISEDPTAPSAQDDRRIYDFVTDDNDSKNYTITEIEEINNGKEDLLDERGIKESIDRNNRLPSRVETEKRRNTNDNQSFRHTGTSSKAIEMDKTTQRRALGRNEKTSKENSEGKLENSEKSSFSLPISNKEVQKDNKGRVLSKEQQEYFKDSKVRDEKGNLKTVYHGTDAKFTVFNYDYLGKNGTANGKGFYLADDINVAKSYSNGKNLIEAYVDIEKPLKIGETTISREEYINFLEKVNEKTNGSLFTDYGDGELVKKGSQQYKDIIKQFQEEYEYGGDDVDLVLSVLNGANIKLEDGYRLLKDTTGYDGIIVETNYRENGEDIPYTQYIPLIPEQIKNVDNINPTNNPDIRYSKNTSNKAEEFLKQVNEMTGKKKRTYFKKIAPVAEQKKTTLQEVKAENSNKSSFLLPIVEKKVNKIAQESDFESVTNTRIAEKRRKKPTLHSFKEQVKKNGNELYQKFVNHNHYLDQHAKATKNDNLKYQADKVLASSGIGQYNIGKAQTDINGNRIGKSIADLFSDIEKNQLSKEFSEYMYLRNNVDREAVNKPIFGEDISSGLSKRMYKQYEEKYPTFKEYAKDIYKYLDNENQLLIDAGLITKNQSDYLKELYPDYVPVERMIENSKIKADDRTLTSGNGIKKATGGNSDIMTLQEAMAKRTMRLRRVVEYNNLMKEVAHSLKNSEVEVEELFDVGSPQVLFETDNSPIQIVDGKYQGIYYENGKAYKFELNKDLYESLKGATKYDIEDYMPLRALQKASKVHRDFLTKYSATFPIKNAIKDIQDVALNSKNLGEFIKAYPKAIVEMKKDGDLWNQYLANGGGNNTYFDYEVGILSSNTKNPIKKIGRKIGEANEFIEQLPRFTEYMATLNKGGSINEALYNAAEITTNFKRGGDITKAINRNGATFLNASVQGFDKFFRNFSEQKNARQWAALSAKVISFGILPALINGLLYDDDEDYKDLPNNDKDLYYLFKYDDGKFIRIPKGRMLSVFGTAAGRTLRAIEGEEDAFEGMGETIANQVAPNNPITDNVVAPIIQASTNKNWFGGEIVGSRLQNELPKNQYDENTSSLAIWLGQKLNMSPKKIDYVIDQYSGGVGDIVLPMTKKAASNKGNVFMDQFTTDSVLKNKNVGKFYDTIEKQTQIANDPNSTDEDKISLDYLNSVNFELSELYKQKREIQNSDLSNKEKQAKVREIQEEINNKVKTGLNEYKNIDKLDEDIYKVKDSTYIKIEGNIKEISDDDKKKIQELKNEGVEEKEYLRYKIDNTYYDENGNMKQKSDAEKMEYILNYNDLSNEKKSNLYKETVGKGDSAYERYNNFDKKDISPYLKYKIELEDIDNPTNADKIDAILKGNYNDTVVKDLYKAVIPTDKDYLSYKGKASTYLRFKSDTEKAKGTKTSASTEDKLNVLIKGNYTNEEVKNLYDTIVSNDDYVYKALKSSDINMKEYLKYKQQDLSADKKDDGTLNGKTISGSSKNKKVQYINSMNITYEQKLILMGSQYKMSNNERTLVAQYINSLDLNARDKMQIYNKMKGFTVYKDGRITW